MSDSSVGLPQPSKDSQKEIEEGTLETATLEGLRRMAGILSGTFILFLFFNLVDFSPPVREIMVAFDAVLVLTFGSIWFCVRRQLILKHQANFFVFVLFVLINANILTAAGLLRLGLIYTVYMGFSIIGSSTVFVSYRWLIYTIAVSLIGWAAVLAPFEPAKQFFNDCFVLVAALSASMGIMSSRRHAHYNSLYLREFASSLLVQRTEEGVARVLGDFARRMTREATWAIQWFSGSCEQRWVAGRGDFPRRHEMERTFLHEGAKEQVALGAGRPVIWSDEGHSSCQAVAIPLTTRKKVFGVVWLSHRGRGGLGLAASNVVTTMAHQASLALESVSLLREVQELALTDELTGLFNRRQFFALARREAQRRAYGSDGGRMLFVVMVDIDHFKRINDTHGHQVGDGVLKEIGTRLQLSLRKTDILGRYGGEEFAIVMSEARPPDGLKVAERLRRSIADVPFRVGELELHVSASFGLVAQSEPDEDLEDLLRKADAALYSAKSSGRNKVEAFSPFGPTG